MAAPRRTFQVETQKGAEQRALPRLDLRHSDGHQCTVKANGEVLFVGSPYDLSLNSVALLVEANRLEHFMSYERFQFDLEIPDYGRFDFHGALISHRQMQNGKVKLAFSLERPSSASTLKVVENGDEFLFPPIYSVNAFMYKPSFFFERTFVRLEAVAPREIRFSVYDLETLLFHGMTLELFLFDAALQLEPLKVLVRQVTRVDESLDVKAEILHFPKAVAKRLSQVLIFDFQLSIEAVKKLALPVPKISDGLRFRFIKSEEEYREVLNLRFKAYQMAGKVADGKTADDMAAPLDHISRILVAYHGSKIVSSIAISFPSSEDLVLDTERAFPGGYPKKIPPKTQSVEIARLCTDPDYRGSDLLLRMFEHTYRTLQCGGRKFIITSTDGRLWPLYKKLGFKKTGMSYPHPYLAGLVHHVIVVPVERAQLAASIDPLRWNYLYRDMNDYLERRGVFQLSRMQRTRLAMFRMIGKVLRIRTKRSL